MIKDLIFIIVMIWLMGLADRMIDPKDTPNPDIYLQDDSDKQYYRKF